jgi:hypothetical protein
MMKAASMRKSKWLAIAASLSLAACASSEESNDVARWILINGGFMSATFFDLESIDRSREPQTLEVLTIGLSPSTGEMYTSKRTFALWCSTREAALKDYSFEYENDSRPKITAAAARLYVRQPIENFDTPGTPGKHGAPPFLNAPTRMAQIVCDGSRVVQKQVDDPVAWFREKVRLPPKG